jgi:hypothetical protein
VVEQNHVPRPAHLGRPHSDERGGADLELGQLDRLEGALHAAEPHRRGAHQAATAVAAPGDDPVVVDLDPGPQNIGETEPVRDSQRLDVAEFAGWPFVVVRESGIKGQPGAALHCFRRDPGQ